MLPTYPNWAKWLTMVMVLVILVLIVLVLGDVIKMDAFSNPNDSQYNNRYVTSGQNPPSVYNGVTYDTNSLQGRLDLATAKGMSNYQAQAQPAKLSGLTGSRDIPVFFQDYDYDVQQKGGSIYNSREGFGGPKKDCGIPGGCE